MKLKFSREWLAKHLANEGDPSACPHCGAMAGACGDYPNCPMGKRPESVMTTTVKVHVNGKYRATVVQDDREPVIVEGNYNGGTGEKSFYLPHPAKGTFVVSEEYVKGGDERPADETGDRNVEQQTSNTERAARSVAGFAGAYGLGIATVWRRIRSGELVAVKVGNRTIITEAAERAWLASLPRVAPKAGA